MTDAWNISQCRDESQSQLICRFLFLLEAWRNLGNESHNNESYLGLKTFQLDLV